MSQPSHMVDQMITATELRLLASIADTTYGSKANKYKAAVYFLEQTSLNDYMPISVKPVQSEAVKYGKTAIGVTANMFGGPQCEAATAPLGTKAPPKLVPALLEKVDVVTSRPMLITTGTTKHPSYGR